VRLCRHVRHGLLLAALVLGGCVCAPAATTAVPTPTATASPSGTPSATPTASPSQTPTAAPGTFISPSGLYRLTLVPPWRRSECLSIASPGDPRILAFESYLAVREEDEVSTDIGSPFDEIFVRAERNTENLTPRGWLQSGKLGQSGTQSIEDATLDGKPAALMKNGPNFIAAYALADRGVMYAIGYRRGSSPTADPAVMERIVLSFHVVADNERPSPTTTPAPAPRSAETVADVLADGFARKDADALATVMAPCMNQGAEQAGGSTMPRVRFVAELRRSFVAGLTVKVQARPIETDNYGTFVRATWTQPGQPGQQTARRDLFLRNDGGRWVWFLVLGRQPPR
jgi:hypothetical protein